MKLFVAHELALAKFELRIEVSELVIWDLYKRGCFLPIFQTLPSSQTPHRHPASALFGRNTTTCPLALPCLINSLFHCSCPYCSSSCISPFFNSVASRPPSPSNWASQCQLLRASSPSIIVSPPSTHPSLLHSSKTLRQGLHVFERVSISPSSHLLASIFFRTSDLFSDSRELLAFL